MPHPTLNPRHRSHCESEENPSDPLKKRSLSLAFSLPSFLGIKTWKAQENQSGRVPPIHEVVCSHERKPCFLKQLMKRSDPEVV